MNKNTVRTANYRDKTDEVIGAILNYETENVFSADEYIEMGKWIIEKAKSFADVNSLEGVTSHEKIRNLLYNNHNTNDIISQVCDRYADLPDDMLTEKAAVAIKNLLYIYGAFAGFCSKFVGKDKDIGLQKNLCLCYADFTGENRIRPIYSPFILIAPIGRTVQSQFETLVFDLSFTNVIAANKFEDIMIKVWMYDHAYLHQNGAINVKISELNKSFINVIAGFVGPRLGA